ncbi:MAG TPA: hypothetical protein VGR01_17740, partial [Burkholderiales bacterium]|nr:hypothetical protein [Burkholderiales bacterium]
VHNDRALRLNPNDPRIVAQKGELLTWLGKPGEGEDWLKMASSLDPHGTHTRAHLLGRALFGSRHYAQALEAYKQIGAPRYSHLAFLAASYAQLGRDAEAREQTAAVLKLEPDFGVKRFVRALAYREMNDRNHLEEALRKAGLPD